MVNRVQFVVKFFLSVYLLYTGVTVYASPLKSCLSLLSLDSFVEAMTGRFRKTPREEWAESPHLIRDAHNVYWLQFSETLLVEVKFWSAHGNPVIKIDSNSEWVNFRPTQPDVPNWEVNVRRGGDLTEITRRDPIFAALDPNEVDEKPSIIIMDGHHRLLGARGNSSLVHIEIGGVRAAYPWEVRAGSWSSRPLF